MPYQKVNTDKAINAILYVSKRLGAPSGVYQSLKAIYYADRANLERFGRLIYGETYIAMDAGPVPSAAYDIVKLVGGRAALPIEAPGAADAMSADKYKIYPKRDADLDLFSQSDLISFERGIEQVRDKDFGQIRDESHGAAYKKADPNGEIAIEDIAAELSDGAKIVAHLADRFPGSADHQ